MPALSRGRRIKCAQKSPSTGLARDGRQRGVGIAGRVPWRQDAFAARAAIGIRDQDTALVIDLDIHEIEQISADVRAAAEPDASALHGVVRRGVNRGPGRAAIESGGHVVPDAVNFGPVNPPEVGVPRKAKAARSLSPATTSGKTTLLIPNTAPTSSGALHVLPLSFDMLMAAVVSPSA